jgi:hypothetical protein
MEAEITCLNQLLEPACKHSRIVAVIWHETPGDKLAASRTAMSPFLLRETLSQTPHPAPKVQNCLNWAFAAQTGIGVVNWSDSNPRRQEYTAVVHQSCQRPN